MPARLFVDLVVERPDRIRTQDLHFHVCRWLELESADHRAKQKPFAISPLARLSDGSIGFEIGVFDDNLVERLLVGIARDGARSLSFGKTTGRLASRDFAEVVARSSWCELLEQADDRFVWQVEALSPTFWRKGNSDFCEPRAGSIVTGLMARWMHWSPITLHAAAKRDGVVKGSAGIAHLRILEEHSDTQVISMPWRRKDREGFVGKVVLAVEEGSAAERARVDALLRFAEFAGIGSMTPFGFGVVQVQRLS